MPMTEKQIEDKLVDILSTDSLDTIPTKRWIIAEYGVSESDAAEIMRRYEEEKQNVEDEAIAETFVNLHNKAMNGELPYPLPYFKPGWPRNPRDAFKNEYFNILGLTHAQERREHMSKADKTYNRFMESVSASIKCTGCGRVLDTISYAKLDDNGNVVLDSTHLIIVDDDGIINLIDASDTSYYHCITCCDLGNGDGT